MIQLLSPRHLLLLALIWLTACAPVSVRNVWRDPAYTGAPPHKVVVMGISRSDVQRRVFEDTFAAYLRQQGLDAQVSYNVLPDNGPIPREEMQKAFAGTGAEAALVARVVAVDRRVDVTSYPYMGPGFYRPGFYGWYGSAWSALPADVYEYKVLTVETTLWNLASGKIVWTAGSQLVEPEDVTHLARTLAQPIVQRMRNDGVL
ncbi:MAG: hypothetical protein QM639_17090 [Rhodocyclaceae bacterium]